MLKEAGKDRSYAELRLTHPKTHGNIEAAGEKKVVVQP